MGLGMNATGWWRTIPVLAERASACSRSTTAASAAATARPAPTRSPQLADDAVAVLDAAGIERAHVYGISLGGMIAQEVALRHPERVAALVLGATTAGRPGACRRRAPDRSRSSARRGEMTAEEAAWASVPYNYARARAPQNGQRIAEDIAQRLRYPIDRARLRSPARGGAWARRGGPAARSRRRRWSSTATRT